MRNPFCAKLRIGLSRTAITLLHTGTAWRAKETLLADTAGPFIDFGAIDTLAPRLRHILNQANCKSLPTAVIMSDDWVRYFVTTPPAEARSLEDCKAAAAMRFQLLYGETPSAWRIEADWHADRPFLSCAMPTALMTLITDIAAEFNHQIVHIVPQFIGAWNRWSRHASPDSWFGAVNGELLTLGVIERHRLRSVHTYPIPTNATASADWFSEHVAREALKLGLPIPARVQLCGAVPSPWFGKKDGRFSCERIGSEDEPAASRGVSLVRTGMPA